MKNVQQLQPVVIYTKQAKSSTKSAPKSYLQGGPIRWTTTVGRGI